MNLLSRYDESVAFLSTHDDDWAKLIELVGPCRHDPKAAREPYEALVRAIAYQQLTAKAGDAIIGRLKGLFEHPQELRPIHFSKRTSATEVRSFAELYPTLRPGELLDGTGNRRYLQAWAMARADSFQPAA